MRLTTLSLALVLAVPLAPLALVACGSSSAGAQDSGSPDTGTPPVSDASDATTNPPDVHSIFGDTGGPPDVATMSNDTGVDAKTDALVSGGEGGAEASVPDATNDGAVTKDTGVDKDTGTKETGPKVEAGACTVVSVVSGTGGANTCPAPVTGSCAPGNISSFHVDSPNPAPSGLYQGICSTAQIQAVYDGCLGPSASDAACSATDEGCYNCIFTDATGGQTVPPPPWGPIVSGSDLIANVNVGGCLQLLEPCNSPCAATFEDAMQCEQAACGPNCGMITTDPEDTAFNACVSTVDGCDPGGCYAYAVGENCSAEISGPAHPGSVCFNTGDFEAQFIAVVPVFCGTAP